MKMMNGGRHSDQFLQKPFIWQHRHKFSVVLRNMNINTFNAFKSRNFRLFFFGQSVSLIGTWMQKTAMSWVVYSLTHSKFMLGLTLFATLFPSFLFSFIGGVIAD